jgi:hypothetical protein
LSCGIDLKKRHFVTKNEFAEALELFITPKEVAIIFEYLDDCKDNTLSVTVLMRELYGIDLEKQEKKQDALTLLNDLKKTLSRTPSDYSKIIARLDALPTQQVAYE